jgi:glycosyltransferase involved in cell wall biosynthesis
MFNGADVAVVIPAYNSAATIRPCLDSLLAQETAPGQILVVDSGSDETAALVAVEYPSVSVTHLPKRTFPGPARNLGVSLTHGAIVAFIDSDCVADPSWVRRLVAAHNATHRIVGGSVQLGNAEGDAAWAGHLGEFREFLPVGEPRSMLHVPTCNISYRRQIFEAGGGFPDAYYPQEDLLFNYMLNRQGLTVWFDPAITVWHYGRATARGYLSHQHRIGRVTRSTLRRIDLPGAWVARRPRLAWSLSPLLSLLKFWRTATIFVTHFPGEALRRPLLLPLLLLGAIWWGRGFAEHVRSGLSGMRGWNDPEEPIFARMAAGTLVLGAPVSPTVPTPEAQRE